MEVGQDDLRRRYRDLETFELLHLHRRGGLTGSAIAVLKEVLDSREPGWEHRDDRWLRSDFESFLREADTLSIPDEFGNLVEPLFLPAGQAPDEMEIRAAEERIGAPLPQGYKLFLRVLGPGCWCRANEISAPADVFVFDESTWEMKGFVAIVENVQGVGDYLAFNPADPQVEGDRPVYYCAHDPYGYARVADSFEIWARECAAAARQEQDFYQQFDEVVSAKSRELEAKEPKRWWHFWR
ncbi:MAG TPA: SMI1/KNR4 family protein [Thermoanaerobaculia bacterium]|nr:SMI1/KNR4 family protein [Thermoanaerobaculia bacterium]